MLAERWLVSYGGLLLYPEPEGRRGRPAGAFTVLYHNVNIFSSVSDLQITITHTYLRI
eukprot:COSAG01_NODE_52304_length_347_cov_1.258065_1_plen_58_part_01